MLNIIFDKITYIIIVSFIVLFVLIICSYLKLNGHKKEIDTLFNLKNKKNIFGKKSKSLKEIEEEVIVTPDTVRDFEKKFNKTRSFYNMWVQLIPIFPLLGILGTVAGLMSQATAGNDINKMYDSLDTALSSTFWGLIAAIALRFIATVFPRRIVDDVDIMIDDYFNKFNDTIVQNHISEE